MTTTQETLTAIQAMCKAKSVEDALQHIADMLGLPQPATHADKTGVVIAFGDVTVVRVQDGVEDVPGHVLNKLVFHTPLKWTLIEDSCKCVHTRISENSAIALALLKESWIPQNDVKIVGAKLIARIKNSSLTLDFARDDCVKHLTKALA